MNILRIPGQGYGKKRTSKAKTKEQAPRKDWFNEPHPVGVVFRAPGVIRDVPEHFGPSGRLITSRSEQREEWKRTGTCQWEKLDDRPRGLTDEKLARARGERVSEAAQDWIAKKERAIVDGSYIKPRSVDNEHKAKVKKAQAEVLQKHGIGA